MDLLPRCEYLVEGLLGILRYLSVLLTGRPCPGFTIGLARQPEWRANGVELKPDIINISSGISIYNESSYIA